ncbi:acetamidase/formamidase family protein [Stackebrandtia nassauensis]|uniref:Acetamidase/Formamidase n=1 Tax=Stackebrandtia nassauensis (strain DSM 44728 / CIP 108903 / NRRL B-16338 / NBRC 102104 / LLR-40K-21) TaxID=446470 RepID=D3Q9L5_STANL|nr:acetamidase/formamidase family protein [Stackebrandtia nassauensis]ADD44561.1 Acetamidase/Formamidase [Stackebrandtia nassauensis DSM 44728]
MGIEPVDIDPKPEQLTYTFGGGQPLARVKPGVPLRLYTEDCFGGRIRTPDDLPSKVVNFPYVNPVTGPFYVEGAEPGDTLALHFASITPARDWASAATLPHFGALTSTSHTATLQDPLPERVWIYDVNREAGTVTYRAANSDFTVDLPLDPMHGTVGVAPAHGEVRSTIVPDAHGGNMDSPLLRAGVTVYLGVNVDGAMFAIGDGHCRQGAGELTGTAVEAAMRTVVIPEVIKGHATPWPRFESDTALMSTGSTRPLEDAFRISQHDLVGWVGALTDLDTMDAYQLLSQAGQAPVANVCDPNYTMVAAVDKRYLPKATAYEGVHAHLRDTARTAGLTSD